jgi:hypothetical protein
MNARFLLSLTFAATAASGATLGCSDECGEGYHLENHLCAADASDGAGGAPDGSGGSGAAGSGEAGAAGEPACDPTFGEDCVTSSECSCDATFCAGYPGEVGICTRTGCVEDPSVCPPDWGCMDLVAFGLPSICTPPT